jgi:hypothetical protein
MEKIIFFSLALPILAFVIYLGGHAIMKGFDAKVNNKPRDDENTNQEESQQLNSDQLSTELKKLNDLFKNGALNQEEFEKAKKKILDN